MKRRFLIYLLITVLISSSVVFASGCLSPGKNTPTPAKQGNQPTKPMVKPENTAPPVQLLTIDSNAKGMLTDLSMGNWSAAQTKFAVVKNAWRAYKKTLDKKGLSKNVITTFEATLNNLQSNINSKNNYGARVATNDITRMTPSFFDLYRNKVPTDIKRMQYLCRQIKLDLESNKWGSAINNANVLNVLWSHLKPKVEAINKNDAATFNTAVTDLLNSVKAKQRNTAQKNVVYKNTNTVLKETSRITNDFK